MNFENNDIDRLIKNPEYKYGYYGDPPWGSHTVYIPYKNRFLTINVHINESNDLYNDNIDRNTAIKILSTFKFTDKGPTIDLKIYSPDLDSEDCSAVSYKIVTVPKTDTPLQDAINLLINSWGDEARTKGFKLISAAIANGVATLKFDDPNFFSSGGSTRVCNLYSQIEKNGSSVSLC